MEGIEGKELLQFRCTECGDCCGLRVVVTDADVARIMKGTGLPVEKIVRFYDSNEVSGGVEDDGWIKLGPKGKFYAMALLEANNTCQFLKNNRCTIYEHRPVTCRVYPFDLVFDDDGNRLELIEINDSCECPHDLDGKVALADLKRNYEWDNEQDDSYFTKLHNWNKRKKPGGKKSFLAYMGLRPDEEAT